MANQDYRYFEYFSGYVPSGAVFLLEANKIAALALEYREDLYSNVNNLCTIGLVAYFEAFLKDHLSCILSIAPELLTNLKKAGYCTDVSAEEILALGAKLRYRIGFLVGEKVDMGTAKRINAIFTSLLKVTPLTIKDAKVFEKLLRDRNLLVHHGGSYTSAYIRQAYAEIPEGRRRVHGDSLQIDSNYVFVKVAFLKRIAHKLITITAERLDESSNTGKRSYTVKKAIEMMQYWDDDIDPNCIIAD